MTQNRSGLLWITTSYVRAYEQEYHDSNHEYQNAAHYLHDPVAPLVSNHGHRKRSSISVCEGDMNDPPVSATLIAVQRSEAMRDFITYPNAPKSRAARTKSGSS